MRIGTGEFLVQKITQEKSAILTKTLNSVKCPCIILCAKMYQYSHYTNFLQEEFTYFGMKALTNFGREVLEQFGTEIHNRKIRKVLKYFLNYTNFLWIIYHAQLSRNPHLTYYENYVLLEKPNLVSLTSPTHLFSTYLILLTLSRFLRLNLNYKKLLKCVKTTSFYVRI